MESPTHTLRYRGPNFLQWSEYSLTPEGVRFREKDIHGTREDIVDYERIGCEPTYFSHHSVIALLATLFFLILSALVGFTYWKGGDAEKSAWLVWLGVAFLPALYFVGTRRVGYVLTSKFGEIALQGSWTKVEPFIAALNERKAKCIQDRLDRRLEVADPREVVKYLLALCEGRVLTNDQYEAIRSNIGLGGSDGQRIGFHA